MKRMISIALLTLSVTALHAKLPAPSDEAKAKAAEAAAKTAHGNKVADFQLCKSREKVAEQYRAQLKKAAKETGPAVDTAACADPGAFVYTPAAPASAPATAVAPAVPVPAKKG